MIIGKNKKEITFEKFFGNTSIEDLKQLDIDFENISNIITYNESDYLEKKSYTIAPLYTYFKNNHLIKPRNGIVCGYKKDGNPKVQTVAYSNLIKYKIDVSSILDSETKANLMNEEIDNGHLEIMKMKDKAMLYGTNNRNNTSMIPPKGRAYAEIKGLFQSAKHITDLEFMELRLDDISDACEKICETELNEYLGEPALIVASDKVTMKINALIMMEKMKNNEELIIESTTVKTRNGYNIPVIADPNIAGDDLIIIGKNSIGLRGSDTLPVLVKYGSNDGVLGDSYCLMDCWTFYVKNPSWVAVIKNIDTST